MNTINCPPVEILVIDDEESMLKKVVDIVRDANYVCHPASTSAEARRIADLIAPDLIISDINLDGENGLELCHEIKVNHGLDGIPLIFVSGAEIPDIIRRSHAVGATYYVRKPFDPAVLADLIEKALWMPSVVEAQIGSSGGSPL